MESEEKMIGQTEPGEPSRGILRRLFDFLASVKLALTLLIIILVCCVAGVTIVRGEKALGLIFYSLWFNGLLVLLVVNVAFCFFSRIWGRKVTLISFGMILFHLSFVVMLGGVVFNSLFYFRGVIRLTEGETLPNGDPQSYDVISRGRFFDFTALKGEVTLVKMHTGYKVGGVDKRIAYEIAIGDGRFKKQGIIYITHGLEYNGFAYFNDKEGLSPLIILSDKKGKEIYGAFVPLQSLKLKNDEFLFTSGTKEGPGSFPFPQAPENPKLFVQVAYYPSKIKEREGNAEFKIWPYGSRDLAERKPLDEGTVPLGRKFDAGDYLLSVKEVRYWVGMFVRYEPGKPAVLASLWVGLGGMILTFIGRMSKKSN